MIGSDPIVRSNYLSWVMILPHSRNTKIWRSWAILCWPGLAKSPISLPSWKVLFMKRMTKALRKNVLRGLELCFFHNFPKHYVFSRFHLFSSSTRSSLPRLGRWKAWSKLSRSWRISLRRLRRSRLMWANFSPPTLSPEGNPSTILIDHRFTGTWKVK